MCAEFDVAPDVALRDAEELVEELARHGIMQVSNSPIQEPS